MSSSFSRANNLTGWLVFVLAAATYIATLEPVASFWDVGEFIAASYKLQVPHPPGAPLFLLIGRVFSMIAPPDSEQVGYWVNMVSALSSAFTSLFLFWTITMLARKMSGEPESLSEPRAWLVLLSGAVGGLAYTFSDSAWFSAVEAEVYAMSSLFTALVFWAILRWEREADEPGADRWLVLIAYLTGLSIGVHLLNLTAAPALALVYFNRRYPQKTAYVWAALGIGLVIVGSIMVGIIPGLPSLANALEVFAVNSLSLPFNTGIILFMLLLLGGIIYGYRELERRRQWAWRNALIATVFILIGYASYGIIVVRSQFAPPINENDPSNAITFVSYLKREQYGDRPLMYGPVYNSQPDRVVSRGPIMVKGEERYDVLGQKYENGYPSSEKVLLPRLYSPQPNHIEAYKNWVRLPSGNRKPSLAANLSFMIRYQMGWMYWRYFMWNFAGRESDIQNASYLMPWDSAKDLPQTLRDNKARNQFFALPLILGILGAIFHARRQGRDALMVAFFFFFTGLAIVIYLNQPPIEPRERDYTFAGSFYAFGIWIGLGVMALEQILSRVLKNPRLSALAAGGLSLIVPTVMIAQGWDDHDRSGRYHSVDSARNLLESCDQNAILFTGGDNDTFPLWYIQEVEGVRRDVRVCNLSLLGTDWYAKQMLLPAYESEPLPMTLRFENFFSGKNDYLPFMALPELAKGADLNTYLKLVKEDHPLINRQTESGSVNILPTKTFRLPVDRNRVKALGYVLERDTASIPNEITWTIGKGALYKPDLLMLDIIAGSRWERPIYFSTTLGTSNYLNLKEYMQQEGLAFRLTPVRRPGAGDGVVNTQVAYRNMMEKMRFRGLADSTAYYDENYRRFPLNARKSFADLTAALLMESQDPSLDEATRQTRREQARKVATYCLEVMPDKGVPFDVYTPSLVPMLLQLGDTARAEHITTTLANRAADELPYLRRKPDFMQTQTQAFILQQLFLAHRNAGRDARARQLSEQLDGYMAIMPQDPGGAADYDE